jgi:16S rRNA (cytidine1402-2'-O)-methyltransferase
MLIICPTPIGNLDDVTPRQRDALAGADVIACEDTRRTGKLLEHLGIARVDGKPALWRYDDHSADQQVAPLVERVAGGDQVVLVSDAGTPTISDPGYRLVRACRTRGLAVTALPGPVAALVALSGAGLPTDRFFFEGFLPTTTEKRRERLSEVCRLPATVVAYESPRRILGLLDDLQEVCGARREVCAARELTKRFEEYLTGTVDEVKRALAERDEIRGEFVVCIAPASDEDGDDDQWEEADRLIEALLEQQLRSRTIKDVVSQLCDVPRSQIYDRIETLKNS